ncbi:biotin/lipoyl-binding protein [uncultured Thiohalocapsa sp.]|uniref:biotin/lipoyl-binding protein n=1 Tax=uncultured Thiohalocapsa sp. TaxID=768990 RepID=UPI0025D55FBE|nr:biotin/lipoyl-binding protein [uncultured Thiohalocapsa sp.]
MSGSALQGQFNRVVDAPASAVPADPKPYIIGGLLVLLVSFGVFGTWSALAPLDSAVVTPGQVKVEARRKVVQHLEGGIVSEILVNDGDRVEEGQMLMRLSDVSPSAQLRIVRLQLYAAFALEARLKAERKNLDAIDFPPDLREAADEDPEVKGMLESEREVFEARLASFNNEREILRRRIEQLRQQITGVEGLLVAQADRIESYQGEVDEWQRLYEAKLADKIRLLQLRRELAELEGEHASTKARLAELKVASARPRRKSS